MPQFDLYRNPRAGVYPLVLDVQSDLFTQLETRVVVPLARRDRYKAPVIGRAIPIVTVDGDEYALVVPLLAAVAQHILGKPIGSLVAHRADIVTALDLLLTGS